MVNEILECPIDDFLKHYAPFCPPKESVDTAHDALKKKSLLKCRKKSKTWALADYMTAPKDIGPSEPVVFKKLEEIMDVLEAENLAGRTCLFHYKDCPYAEVASEIDGTNFKVDARITKNPEAKKFILSDAAVVAEYKKDNKPDDVADVSPCNNIFRASGVLTLFLIESPEAGLSSHSDHE